jgi:cytochrome P450
MTRGRRLDRRVYLRSHPVLFALVSASRFAPAVRLGRTVLVHDRDAYVDGLVRIPLDRTAAGTTGGIARAAGGTDGLVFDEEGVAHKGTRRDVADLMGAAAVARLAPVWREVLARRLAPLADRGRVDMVDLALELTGATAAALLDAPADPLALARAARAAAAAAARDNLPGPRAAAGPGDTAAALVDLAGSPRAAMLAVAAVNTMTAALPRAVAWCATDGLWPAAADPATRPALVDELLRVLAPAPLLPRVAAGEGVLGGRRVRPGDRLILVARHAAGAHRAGPDPAAPAPAQQAQLVFGAGPHACPGARLARAQLADTLAALAPHRPVVTRIRVDRDSALPGWSTVEVVAGLRRPHGEASRAGPAGGLRGPHGDASRAGPAG